jgi:hypothetical protein
MPVIELSSDGVDMVVPCRNTFERRYFLYVLGLELNAQPDSPPKRKLQPCAGCGRPSVLRWCSNACFWAEDGPPDDHVTDEEE